MPILGGIEVDNVSVDVDVYCDKCGKKLVADAHNKDIYVEPCEDCISKVEQELQVQIGSMEDEIIELRELARERRQ